MEKGLEMVGNSVMEYDRSIPLYLRAEKHGGELHSTCQDSNPFLMHSADDWVRALFTNSFFAPILGRKFSMAQQVGS